jgi:hypothetical protein
MIEPAVTTRSRRFVRLLIVPPGALVTFAIL